MRSPVTHSLLPTIDDPSMLRALPRESLGQVADELRDYLIRTISASGGHLASGGEMASARRDRADQVVTQFVGHLPETFARQRAQHRRIVDGR